jgi:hypothetical protein
MQQLVKDLPHSSNVPSDSEGDGATEGDGAVSIDLPPPDFTDNNQCSDSELDGENGGEEDAHDYFLNHSFGSSPSTNPWSDNSVADDSSEGDKDPEPSLYSHSFRTKYNSALVDALNKWWVKNRAIPYVAYSELLHILR